MKRLLFNLGIAVILLGGYFYFEYGQNLGGQIAPDYLYPQTQGKIATSNYNDLIREYNGKSYSQAHRLITRKQKQEVCKRYDCKVSGQFDHFVSIALGGSTDTENIWYQPKVNMWNGENYGYSEKDRLEAYLIQEMKAKRLTPKEAQEILKKDWVRAYQKYIAGRGKFSGEDFNDNEDEVVDN